MITSVYYINKLFLKNQTTPVKFQLLFSNDVLSFDTEDYIEKLLLKHFNNCEWVFSIDDYVKHALEKKIVHGILGVEYQHLSLNGDKILWNHPSTIGATKDNNIIIKASSTKEVLDNLNSFYNKYVLVEYLDQPSFEEEVKEIQNNDIGVFVNNMNKSKFQKMVRDGVSEFGIPPAVWLW